MRMAFGLVSLLVSVAIMLYMMVGGGGTGGPGYLGSVAQANKQLKGQANVLSGYDPTRQVLATDSIHYRVDRTAATPKLLITGVMAGGPMDEHFGLRVGDRVVEIGGLDFVQNIGSHDGATEWLGVAYARGQPIVVMRGNERLTLPTPEHVASIAARDKQTAMTAAAANMPVPTPAGTPVDDRSALQRGIDALRSGK